MGLVLRREHTYSDSVKSLAVLCETYSLNLPFPTLPSVAQLTDHWDEYKEHLTSKRYTLDLLGTTPLCQVLATIRDRIKGELAQKAFVLPVLLLIISDGVSTDGDPLPIITELHEMGVLTLCCYLGEQDILNAKRLYEVEDFGGLKVQSVCFVWHLF